MNKSVQWFLVSNCGLSVPLPQTMISLGRDGCDVVLQSRSVDKRHAVITYDHHEKRFKVKDLNSINGTYLNSVRIPSQAFVKLEHLDSLRFAFAIYQVQVVERIPQFTITPYDYQPRQPLWNTHPYAPNHMKTAECQGCLYKQAIQHTCGMKGGGVEKQPPNLHYHQPQQQMASQSPAAQDPSLQNYPHQNAQDLCGNIIATTACSPPPPVATQLESSMVAPQVRQGGGYVTEGVSVMSNSGSVDMNGSCHGHGACSLGYHYPQQAQTPQQCSCQASSNSYRQSANSSPLSTPYAGLPSMAIMQPPVSQGESKGFAGGALNSLERHHDVQVDSAKQQGGPVGSPTLNGAKTGIVTPQGIVSVMEAEKPYSQTSKDAAIDHARQPIASPTNVSPAATPESRGNDQLAGSPGSSATSQSAEDGLSGSKSDTASFPSCTAFTVDFTDDRPHNKRLDIRDSISKFAPHKSESEPKLGHRRNHSLPKDEEYKVLDYLSDENGNSDGNKTSPTNTPVREGKKESDFAIGTTLSAAKARLLATAKGMRGGYRSEGHVSSDQDDELSSKSDPTMNPKGNAKIPVAPPVKPANNSHEFSPLETPGSRRSLPVAGLRDSAKYLISKMFGEVVAPPASPTDPPSPLYLPLANSNAKNAPGHHDKQHLKGAGGGPQVEYPLTKNDGKSGSRSSLTSNTTYTVDGREFGNSHTLPRTKVRPTDLSFVKDGTKCGWVEEALSEDEGSDEEDEAPADIRNGSGDIEEEEGGSCENASEAGTYTIEKDDKGEEETEARRNIDAVFGVTGDYSVQRSTTVGDEDDDVVCGEAGEPVELRPKNTKPTALDARALSTGTRKGNSSWLKEWVTQTASSAAGDSSSTPSPPNLEANVWRTKSVNLVGYTNMPAAQYPRPSENSSPIVSGASDGDKTTENSGQRPRRKLPVLPVDKVPLAPSPGGRIVPQVPISQPHDTSLSERSPALPTNALLPSDTQRKSSSSSRTSPEGRRSDSSMDTETILRDTETVVTAMEARMDSRRKMDSVSHRIASSSLESRDSGGESDNEDTSAASGGGTRQSLNKKLSDQLKMQLRHLEQDAGGHRRLDNRGTGQMNGVDVPEIHLPTDHHHRHLHHQRGKASPSGCADHGDNLSELETVSLHSDVSTSSDLSGSSPGGSGKRKGWSSSDGGNAPLMRLNRAFSLRRARLGCDGEPPAAASSPKTLAQPRKLAAPSPGPPSSSRPSSAGSVNSNRDRGWRSSTSNRSDSGASAASGGRSAPPPATDSFSRSDGGRFSLRLPRSAPIPVRPQSGKVYSQHPPVAPPRKNAASKLAAASKPGLSSSPNTRSNSTLSAKELEMKNWKRRKTYDPLKAAAEGRRKEAVKKVGGVLGGTMHGSLMSKSESPSPTTSHFQRSASFHGTDGLSNRRNTFSLHNDEDEDTEEFSDDNQAPPRHHGNGATVYDSTTQNPQEHIPDDVFSVHRGKKSSESEFISEASRAYSHTDLTNETYSNSPRGSPMLPSAHGHKSKVDALDNLVISTIHQLSNNLRTNAELVLKKLNDVHSLECDEALGTDGVQDLMRQMNLLESPVSSPQAPGVSRQLSGILKNMKCLEESLQVVNKVLATVPATDAHRCPSNCNNDAKRHTGENASHHAVKTKSAQKKWNGFKSSDYY